MKFLGYFKDALKKNQIFHRHLLIVPSKYHDLMSLQQCCKCKFITVILLPISVRFNSLFYEGLDESGKIRY